MTTIIFDYDGTLHESMFIYVPAFKKAVHYLNTKNLLDKRDYTDAEISKWLGFTAKEMWQSFAPHISKEEQGVCSQIIGNEMLRLIEIGEAKLYPQTLEVLADLKQKGYRLIFLSNCKIEYMNAHKHYFELEKYFDAFYCSEQFDFVPKHELFKVIKKKFTGDFIVIGDRMQDIEIATVHHLRSIGCLYGYAHERELENASCSIVEIGQLIDML